MNRENDDFERMLLRAGRQQRAPEGLRARSLAAAAAASVAGTVAASTGGATGSGLLAKALIMARLGTVKWAVVVASIGVAGGYVAVKLAPGRTPAPLVAPAPSGPERPADRVVASVPPTPVLEEEPGPSTAPVPTPSAAPAPALPKPVRLAMGAPSATAEAEAVPSAEPAPPAPKVGLADEVRIIDAARAALAVQNPARTLDLVAEHGKKHPSGALVAERDALRVDALMMEGRTGEASTAALAYLRDHPRSAQRARMIRISQQQQFE